MPKRKIKNLKDTAIDLSGIQGMVFGLKNYITYTINYSFDYEREIALSNILSTSSILLSIASGFTTFRGLNQYAHWFIAILLTLGIQFLLFVSSWKIGRTTISKIILKDEIDIQKKVDYQKPKISLFLIWILTMSVSVFFSYSSLFIEIYKDNEKNSNRDILAMTESQKILNQLNQYVFEKNKSGINRQEYVKWKTTLFQKIHEVQMDISNKKNEFQKNSIENENFKETEIKYGGTRLPNGTITTSGQGSESIRYKTEAQFNQAKYSEYIEKEEKIKSNVVKLNNFLSNFEVKYEVSILDQSLDICNEIFVEYGEVKGICNLDIIDRGHQIDVTLFKKSCNVELLGKGFDKDLLLIRRCISKARLDEKKSEDMLRNLDSIQKTEGVNAHEFIIVTNEIKHGNRLAIGTLLLAITIDLLILFCSLLGSKNESFLYMDVDDLFKRQEQALEIVLSADTSLSDKDSEMIQKIKVILNELYYNEQHENTSYPAVLSQEKIHQLKLQKFLGILQHLKLIETLDDGSIGLRNRAILWMNHQIVKNNSARNTEDDLYRVADSIKDENHE